MVKLNVYTNVKFQPRYEKTGFLHMLKQRRRLSAKSMPRHTKNRPVDLARFSLKFYRLRTSFEEKRAKSTRQFLMCQDLNCTADQRLCFRYTDSTVPLLSKCKAISWGCTARFLSDLVENPEDNFLASRLNF